MLLAALLATPAASARQGTRPAPQPDDTRVLFERDRATMHPGDPLRVAGLEADGNDLRSRTPALAKAVRGSTERDPEVARERALAMFALRARFSAAPPARPAPDAAGREETGPSAAPARAKATARDTAWPTWTWVSALGVVAAVVVAWRGGLRTFLRHAS